MKRTTQQNLLDLPEVKRAVSNHKKQIHQWLQENNGQTSYSKGIEEPWCAWIGQMDQALEDGKLAVGKTEELAVENLKSEVFDNP